MTEAWLPAGERAGGILLHPTSLPSPFGIGDLGPAARRWLDWLAASGCCIWQVLPLGPTGYGDSPYQSFSAMAGNPLLISPQDLASEGLLSAASLEEAGENPDGPVDFGSVIDIKNQLLGQAYAAFRGASGDPLRAEYAAFLDRERGWLDDFALFMALKAAHHGAAWTVWPPVRAPNDPPPLGLDTPRQARGYSTNDYGSNTTFTASPLRDRSNPRDHSSSGKTCVINCEGLIAPRSNNDNALSQLVNFEL